jgi:hypothetical protein
VLHPIDRNAACEPAALQSGAPPGGLNEDPAHRLGGCGEEVPSIVEPLAAEQTQVRLMNQSGGIESMVRSFDGHAGSGKLTQLLIYQRHEAFRRLRISSFDRE